MKNHKYIIIALSLLFAININAQNQCEVEPVICTLKIEEIPFTQPDNDVKSVLSFDDERVVGYVHGIGGGTNTWVSARNWTENEYDRAFTPVEMDYNMISVDDASNDIQGDILAANSDHQYALTQASKETYDVTQSFLVAHSLGGIVARDAEYRTVNSNQALWQQQFGGLITFGTPHQGTSLVTDENVALASDVANRGCHLATQAYLTEFIEENFSDFGILSGFMKNTLYSITLEKESTVSSQGGITVESIVCDNIVNSGLDFLLSSMLPPISKDMAPNSNTNAKLNGHDFTYPLIACYGVEDDPVSLRQIAGTRNNIDAFAFGGADLKNEEDAIIEAYNDYVLGLEAGYDFYSTLDSSGADWRSAWNGAVNGFGLGGVISGGFPGAIVGGLIGGILGFFTSSPPDYDAIAIDFFQYWQWTLNFDLNYRLVMGIDDATVVLGQGPSCECFVEFEPNYPVELGDADCDDPINQELTCVEIMVPIYVTVIEKHESDGTVRAESASQVPHSHSFISYDMPGSNHVQMKNDRNISNILIEIFEGVEEGTEYFNLVD